MTSHSQDLLICPVCGVVQERHSPENRSRKGVKRVCESCGAPFKYSVKVDITVKRLYESTAIEEN